MKACERLLVVFSMVGTTTVAAFQRNVFSGAFLIAGICYSAGGQCQSHLLLVAPKNANGGILGWPVGGQIAFETILVYAQCQSQTSNTRMQDLARRHVRPR